MTALKLEGGAALLGRGALRAAAAAAALSASFFAALNAALRFVLGAMLGTDPATLLGRGLSFGALSPEAVAAGLGPAAELLGRGAIEGRGGGFEAAGFVAGGLATVGLFLSAAAGTTDARRPTA